MSLEIGIDQSPFCPPKSSIRDRQQSDADYIEKLRKSVRSMDRWGRCLVAFHVTIIVVVLLMASKVFEVLQQLGPMFSPQFQTPSLSFTLGIALGAKIGFWVLCSMAAIVQVLFGMRTERLLIKYYDRQVAGEVLR